MPRWHYLLIAGIALALAACGAAPAAPDTSTPTESAPTIPTEEDTAIPATEIPATSIPPATEPAGEPVAATPIVITAQVATVVAVTVDPQGQITPATAPPLPTPTPIVTVAGSLGYTELKYRVLAQFPDFFFCDPDYYPVARADEQELAIQKFPELQANAEEFNTILAHNGLSGVSEFSDEQKLLIYREHKKLAALFFEKVATGYQFQIQVAKSEGQGELVTGVIDGQGNITVLKREPAFVTCPICLGAGTRIDTPDGPVRVEDLRVGMLVWTVSAAGERVAAPLIRVSRTVAPASHQVVHVILDDGREVWVSAGHPTADGRRVGDLRPGDWLDGARVVSVEREAYSEAATYDLLPAGETGFYWADGILLGSTLGEEGMNPSP